MRTTSCRPRSARPPGALDEPCAPSARLRRAYGLRCRRGPGYRRAAAEDRAPMNPARPRPATARRPPARCSHRASSASAVPAISWRAASGRAATALDPSTLSEWAAAACPLSRPSGSTSRTRPASPPRSAAVWQRFGCLDVSSTTPARAFGRSRHVCRGLERRSDERRRQRSDDPQVLLSCRAGGGTIVNVSAIAAAPLALCLALPL